MNTPALIAEATRRSGVAWVTPAGSDHAQPVWQLWHDGDMYVVTGGLEQPLPPMTRAAVSLRSKEKQADLLVTWLAEVTVVEPADAKWQEVVPLLHVRRLNAPDGEQQPARWARESLVLRFHPCPEAQR